jgi:hypothetical protein
VTLAALALGAAGLAAWPAPHGPDPHGAPGPTGGETLDAVEAGAACDRAFDWLLAHQRPDGSWSSGVADSVQELGYSVESHYAWKVAAHALACQALRIGRETPARRAALERGLDYLVSARMPQRGNDWDTDYGWSTLYAFVLLVDAVRDPRFAGAEWQEKLESAGRRYLDLLLRLQTPSGGWAYYDDPIFSRRPTWDTSFCTALVLPSLQAALSLGWFDDETVLTRAQRYVSRCALPNGAYAYDLGKVAVLRGGEDIDNVKGSLARIQVCNWGLARTGIAKITAARVREGLEAFFEHHRFLDAARLRPIPHEAYYYNAGYFYLFGHYYAAEAIQLLPEAEREGWHARLRPHVVRAQRADGSGLDFIDSSYEQTACTAYVALALSLGLGDVDG